MTWAKIDDGFLDHPKTLRAGEDAANLYLRALVWCNRHLTDGEIPREALRAITGRRDAKQLASRLVEVNLWETTANGWVVHDFADHNPSREAVLAARVELSAKRAEAGRRGGKASGFARGGKQTRSNLLPGNEAIASGLLKQNEAPTRPVPSRPEEGEERDPPTPASGGGADEVRCGTVEVARPADPTTPTADAVLDLLARKSGGNLDARGTIDTLKHFKRAVDELRYPMLAWEHLAAQTALDPTRLWSSTYLLGRLNGQGGRVTLQLLLGRRLPDADPTRCAYDCAPLQEAINSARREALAREARTNG